MNDIKDIKLKALRGYLGNKSLNSLIIPDSETFDKKGYRVCEASSSKLVFAYLVSLQKSDKTEYYLNYTFNKNSFVYDCMITENQSHNIFIFLEEDCKKILTDPVFIEFIMSIDINAGKQLHNERSREGLDFSTKFIIDI